jgi:hypothetical protein
MHAEKSPPRASRVLMEKELASLTLAKFAAVAKGLEKYWMWNSN